MTKKPKLSKVFLKDLLIPIEQPVELNDDKEYVTIKIKRNFGGIQTREKLQGYKIKTKKQFKVISGSFIISKVQCWHKPFAIVPENFPSNSIISVNYDQFGFSKLIDKQYLWWLSHSPFFVKTVRDCASGVDIEKMRLDTKKWLSYQILIPSMDVQKKIASRIEQIESSKISMLSLFQNFETNLQLMKQSFLETAISDLNNSKKKLLDKKVFEELQIPESFKNKLIDLPPNWKWTSLSELIIDMKNGLYKSAEFYGKGIPSLRMYNIYDGKIILKDVKEMILTKKEINEFGLKQGDILFNRVNSKELLGKSAVIPKGLGKLVFESKNIRIKVNQEMIEADFFVEFLKTKFARFQIEYLRKQTAGMASISQEDIRKLIIPLPPIVEQKVIIEKINKISRNLSELSIRIKKSIERAEMITNSIISKEFQINPQLELNN